MALGRWNRVKYLFLRFRIKLCYRVIKCAQDVQMRHSDLLLFLMAPRRESDTILPFTTTEFSIFYKAGEFHLSPTYFIDGLSTELWIFIWSFFFMFFLGLLVSVKVYRRFFRIDAMTVSDMAMFEMSFVATQTHALPTNEQERFLSWKIQMICQSIFHIVIACAFSAFILALLSIKTTEESFYSLDDFAVKRTHVICNYPGLDTEKYFSHYEGENLVPNEKFKGIYNEDVCILVLTRQNDAAICAHENVALVFPTWQFKE